MDEYLGEIRIIGFNFAPVGWALCNGQILQISQYSALYALLGTTFGGNGTTTFGLPDLQCRIPIDVGNGTGLPPAVWGQKDGAASVVLQSSNLPAHTHTIAPPVSNAAGTASSPVSTFPANDDTAVTVTNPTGGRATAVTKSYAASSVAGQTAGSYQSGAAGNNVPVSIMPPSLALYYIIATEGIFPTRG